MIFNMILSPEYLKIRDSGFFDANYYLDNYQDVKESSEDPLDHYLRCGFKEGRNPSEDFQTNFYLHTYPDVAAAGINPLLHFILHGQFEHRQIHPSPPPGLQLETAATPRREKPYYLTICAMGSEEAPYLDEWIAYHKVKGVDHIYLRYEENAHDILQARTILKTWEATGFIDVEYGPTAGMQGRYYREATIGKIKDECQWCAYLDLDEFIWTPGDDLFYHINYMLKVLEDKVDILELDWIFFGDHGLKEYEDELLVNRFPSHQSTELYLGDGQIDFKSVVNFNERVLAALKDYPEIFHHHTIFNETPLRRVGADLKIQTIDGRHDNPQRQLRTYPLIHFALCHFYCKTPEEFKRKAQRPSAATPGQADRHFIERLYDKRNRNEMKTHTLAHYADAIKSAIPSS